MILNQNRLLADDSDEKSYFYFFMKYLALFVTFENATKFEIVVCCKLKVALSRLWDFVVRTFHLLSLAD